jgi:hypothetical protein
LGIEVGCSCTSKDKCNDEKRGCFHALFNQN